MYTYITYLTYYIYNLTYIMTNVPNKPLLTQYNLIYTYLLHGTLTPTSCPPRTDANIGLKMRDQPSPHCLPAKDAHVTLIYIINNYTSLQYPPPKSEKGGIYVKHEFHLFPYDILSIRSRQCIRYHAQATQYMSDFNVSVL